MEEFITAVTYLLVGLIGLCVGSFLNVVIYRLPNKMSLAKPASHCPQCGYQLKWYDNIPVISYCILGGKCRSCKKHIPFRYTAVELLNMLLWLACALVFWNESVPYACIAMAVCSIGICVTFIDLEHLIIFDRFQIMLLVLGAASIPFDVHRPWYSHLIGLVAGFAAFWLFAFLGGKMFGREALGGGDVKLVACIGLLLGWEKLLLCILLSSIIASIVLLILRSKRKDEKGREYPFGPFLVLGTAVSMLLGDRLIDWYMGLLSGAV